MALRDYVWKTGKQGPVEIRITPRFVQLLFKGDLIASYDREKHLHRFFYRGIQSEQGKLDAWNNWLKSCGTPFSMRGGVGELLRFTTFGQNHYGEGRVYGRTPYRLDHVFVMPESTGKAPVKTGEEIDPEAEEIAF